MQLVSGQLRAVSEWVRGAPGLKFSLSRAASPGPGASPRD